MVFHCQQNNILFHVCLVWQSRDICYNLFLSIMVIPSRPWRWWSSSWIVMSVSASTAATAATTAAIWWVIPTIIVTSFRRVISTVIVTSSRRWRPSAMGISSWGSIPRSVWRYRVRHSLYYFPKKSVVGFTLRNDLRTLKSPRHEKLKSWHLPVI